MDARYAICNTQLLDECQVAPEIFEQVIPRLYTVMEPVVTTFPGQVAEQQATTYVCGLLSDVEQKNVESIAYRFGPSRLPLQGVIGWAEWDDAPLRAALIRHVHRHLGQGEGGVVCDPSAFPTSGRESVGGARQWCGRLGKVAHCQGAISLGYVSRKGHSLVDTRLSLPPAWTKDQARLDNAGVPRACRGFRTRHQLAVERLAQNRASLPHGWIAGDDERGRAYGFRRWLASVGERYWLAVPAHTAMRDLEVEPPGSSGRGRPPKRPWQRVEVWRPSLDDAAGQRIDVRDGSQGPLVVEVVTRRVVSRTPRRQQGEEELVVVIRSRDRDQEQVVTVEYSLSNAVSETPRWALARVATAAHRIEECMQRSKSAAGLAEYEGRHWTGWQQHQTLSFLATGFLERETQGGKKMAPCDHLATDAPGHRHDLTRRVSGRNDVAVVLENSNVEKLASNLYLSAHPLPQEDHHDTDDASAGEVYPILVPSSTVYVLQSSRRGQYRASVVDRHAQTH